VSGKTGYEKEAVERLLEIFRGLPSFYEGRFIPSVLEKPEGQG
jgi:hypothetical protein